MRYWWGHHEGKEASYVMSDSFSRSEQQDLKDEPSMPNSSAISWTIISSGAEEPRLLSFRMVIA